MGKITFIKTKKILSRIWGIALFSIFANNALARSMQAEYGVLAPIQMKYGVPIYTPPSTPVIPTSLPQPLYGVPAYPVTPPPVTPPATLPHTPYPSFLPQPAYGIYPVVPEYGTLEKVLATVILPLIVLAVLAVGIFLYFRSRNKNKNVK